MIPGLLSKRSAYTGDVLFLFTSKSRHMSRPPLIQCILRTILSEQFGSAEDPIPEPRKIARAQLPAVKIL